MKKPLRYPLLAALALGSVSALNGAVAFVNGDFEANASSYVVWPGYNNSVGVNTQPAPSNPAAPAGWTAEGGAGVNRDGLLSTDSIAAGQFVGAQVNPFIDNGIKTGAAAFLQGNSHIEQTITGFVIGTQYVLSFNYNARTGPATTEGSVSINGVDVVPWSPVSPVGADNPFRSLEIPFAAASDTLTFRFSNRVPAAGGDVTLLLDNISVRAIPEPTAAALLLLGSTTLLRRRRQG